MRADNLTDRPVLADAPELRIEALLARASALLRPRADAPRLQAELLLSHALGRPRSYLIGHARSAIPVSAAAHFDTLLVRAAAGEPVAYLTGEREFWSLPLAVSPAVLIPRPETELVVERCLALAASGSARVCDLGTGSGAIAVALAHERPHWQIMATDRCGAALELARHNAARLAIANIEFVQGDWFAPLISRRFDLIASNPPYIGAGDPALHALRHEPRGALTPGATGLEALQHIVVEAPAHLSAGGWLILEHGAEQASALRQALRTRGYAPVREHRDLAGRDRVSEAQWSGP